MKHNAINEYHSLVLKLSLTKEEEACLDEIREIGINQALILIQERRKQNGY